MPIEFDPAKRAWTLAERGLDFNDAPAVIEAPTRYDVPVIREGEARTVTYGLLRGRLVAIVWTWRGAGRRIISMRKANAKEQARYRSAVGRP